MTPADFSLSEYEDAFDEIRDRIGDLETGSHFL